MQLQLNNVILSSIRNNAIVELKALRGRFNSGSLSWHEYATEKDRLERQLRRLNYQLRGVSS